MAESKRALLVIAGGRALPDAIAFFYVKPEIVVYLKSQEGWDFEEGFIDVVKSESTCTEYRAISDVDAYSLEAGRKACEDAIQLYPEADWTITIGAGPKLTGIAAYEIAKRRNIPCLYVSTLYDKLVSVDRDHIIDASTSTFHPTIETYLKLYHRTCKPRVMKKIANYRSLAESWSHIAQELAHSNHTADFTTSMHDKKIADTASIDQSLASSPLIQSLAYNHKLISLNVDPSGKTICRFTSPAAAQFLGTGDWLEIYAWSSIQPGSKKEKFADDYQWAWYINDGPALKEIDLLLTHKAQLIIGECKTGKESFSSNHLDKLHSISHWLGGRAVTKLFITDQPQTRKNYRPFKALADQLGVVVITKEDLSQLDDILKRQTVRPTYPRI